MKPKLYLLSLLSLAFFLSSCGGGKTSTAGGAKTPVAAEKAESAFDLFPVAPGNDWTYEVNGRSVSRQAGAQFSTYDLTFKCANVTENGNNKDAEIVVTNKEGAVIERILFRVTPSEIYLLGYIMEGQKRLHSQPLLLLSWPVKPGHTYTWKAQGPVNNRGQMGDLSATITVKGEVETDTSAERLKAYRVDVSMTQTLGGNTHRVQSIYFFAPKRGLVRYWDSRLFATGEQAEVLMRLKSHTIK
jgi:hypothetical protein